MVRSIAFAAGGSACAGVIGNTLRSKGTIELILKPTLIVTGSTHTRIQKFFINFAFPLCGAMCPPPTRVDGGLCGQSILWIVDSQFCDIPPTLNFFAFSFVEIVMVYW